MKTVDRVIVGLFAAGVWALVSFWEDIMKTVDRVIVGLLAVGIRALVSVTVFSPGTSLAL